MILDSANDLVVIDQASRALAEAKTLGEIKAIRDKAEAVRKYAASAALGLSAQNYAAEVKLRAERKAGQLLTEMRLRGGDRKSNEHDDRLKLEDLGISQNQSTRWQLEARLPGRDFEDYLRSTREAGREIATTAVLRLARRVGRNGESHTTNINGQRTSSTSKHVSDSANGFGMQSPIDDGLVELSHHRDLLDQILEPLYTGNETELLPAQRRVLGHILREMAILLHQMRQITQHQ